MDIILESKYLQDKDTAQPYLKDMLGFPDYYGMNLDALYDCLTDISVPSIIRIQITTDKCSAYFDKILKVFEDAQDQNAGLTVRSAHGYYVEG